MKKQTVIKNGFYKGFLQDQEESKQQTQQKEQIVIISQKEKDSFLKAIFNALGAVFQYLIFALLFALSSVGLTALLNEEIRKLLLNLL